MRRENRWWALGALGVALILGLGLLAFFGATDPARTAEVDEYLGPRPSGTRRGRPSEPGRAVAVQPVAPASAVDRSQEPAPSRVLVTVRPLDESRIDRNTFFMPDLRPHHWLPTAEEFGLEGNETAENLDDYLDSLGPMPVRADDEGLAALLETAHEEGLFSAPVDLDDPWMALFQLNLTWLNDLHVASNEFDTAMEVFSARFGAGPYEGQPSLLSRDADARAYWDELNTRQDLSETLGLADDILALHPDHPVADYARLYAMGTVMNVSAEQYDVTDAFHRALEAFEGSDDRWVTGAAMSTLSGGGRVHVEERDRRALESAAERHPEHLDTISMFAMEAAYSEGDPILAAQWWRRLSLAVTRHCTCSEALPFDGCSTKCAWVDDAEQQLVAVGAMGAVSWVGALRATVQRCAWEADVPPSRLEAEGQWRDGWDWTSVTPDGEMATCLQAAVWEGPAPQPNVQVHVVYGQPDYGSGRMIPVGG